MTSDHSPIGQREDSGALGELEAMKHPRRNEVFRDVGSQSHKPDDADFIEYRQIPFDRDAAIVLCSDGLSDMLTSNEILRCVLENAGSPRDSVRRLIEEANAAGGKDNISAIVVEAEGFAEANAADKNRLKKNLNSAVSTPQRDWKRLPFGLGNRWAFFLYGSIVGLSAFSLWSISQRPAPELPAARQAEALPKTLKVSPSGPDYSTIGQALDAARVGDCIEIGDGEYEESIRLKEGVDLWARSPGRAVLRLTRPRPEMDAAVIAEGIKRASVAGLAIKMDLAAGFEYGIRISNSNATFSNIEVAGAERAGVLINGDSVGTLSAGYIHDNSGSGILVGDNANPFLVGNVIYANGASGDRKYPGLRIMGNSNPEVKRNVFSRNGAGAILLQKPELKDSMKDNLFLDSGKRPAAIVIEKAGT